MIWGRPIKKPVISSDFVARIPLLRSEDSKELVPILPDGHTLYDKYLHSVHQVNLHLLLNEICPPTEVSSCHFWGGILVTENAVGGLFFFLYTQVHTNKPSWQNSHVFFQQGFRLKLLPIFAEMKKETAGT